MRYYNNKGNGVTVCDGSQAGGSVLNFKWYWSIGQLCQTETAAR